MFLPKSGACPVIPKTVVFKYLSCPARSINVITLEDFSHIFTQSSDPCSGLLTTLPTNQQYDIINNTSNNMIVRDEK